MSLDSELREGRNQTAGSIMTHKTKYRHQILASPTVSISKDADLSEKLRFPLERHGDDVNRVLNFSTNTNHTKGTGQAPSRQ